MMESSLNGKFMQPTPLQQAIENNARWCETICAAHGIPGEFHEDLWLNRQRVPRFYPNLVTLTPARGVARQYAAIQDLIASADPGSVSVKDSFNTLDLLPLGLRSLFEATWLWRSPNLPMPAAPIGDRHYTRVQKAADLAAWEHMWGGQPATRLFVPTLLDDPHVAFIAAYQQQQLVGGAIANRTGAVVGVSNIVVPQEDPAFWWAGLLAAIIDLFPGMALVGYEQGNDLAIAQALGFTAIGTLRVWAQ
jgi:hypothetical protein